MRTSRDGDGLIKSIREACRTLPAARFEAAWKILARLGLMGLPFAKRDGGAGRGRAEAVRALEALGERLPFTGLPLAVGAQMWCVQSALSRFGTRAQRERFLRPLCRGAGIAAPAITEEDAGSDVLGMRAEAVRAGGGYSVSGRKTFVSSGPHATLFLVWARTGRARGPMGLSCFLIPRDSRGARTAPLRTPAATLGALEMKDCRVPAANRLGGEGQGWPILQHALNMERRFILAPAVGAMERTLRDAAAYARSRKQFGQPIGSFQAVAHRLADMKIRLAACRALLAQACQGEDGIADETGSIVKAFISEAWLHNCLDAIQIHGAKGCLLNEDLQSQLSAALSSRVLSGSNEIQRNLVAARLLDGQG